MANRDNHNIDEQINRHIHKSDKNRHSLKWALTDRGRYGQILAGRDRN